MEHVYSMESYSSRWNDGNFENTPKSTHTENDNTNNDYETIKTDTTNEAEVKTESTELLATPQQLPVQPMQRIKKATSNAMKLRREKKL